MTVKFTSMGSPCSDKWDDAWIARVGAEERSLGKRICGARLKNGEPCRASTRHASGRCPYHGGVEQTGAPDANCNALVHGLYIRGLQRCGTHCPMWRHCPVFRKEIMDMPERHRPECPYEIQHFEAVLGENDGNIENAPEDLQLLALSKVMMLRAATAMSISPLFTTDKDGNANKVHPALDAYRRLSTEYHRQKSDQRRNPAASPPQDPPPPPPPAPSSPYSPPAPPTPPTPSSPSPPSPPSTPPIPDLPPVLAPSKSAQRILKKHAQITAALTSLHQEHTLATQNLAATERQLKLERQTFGRTSEPTQNQLTHHRKALQRLNRQIKKLERELTKLNLRRGG